MTHSYRILYDILKDHFYLSCDEMGIFMSENRGKMINICNNNIYINNNGNWVLIFLVDRETIIELLNPYICDWILEN